MLHRLCTKNHSVHGVASYRGCLNFTAPCRVTHISGLVIFEHMLKGQGLLFHFTKGTSIGKTLKSIEKLLASTEAKTMASVFSAKRFWTKLTWRCILVPVNNFGVPSIFWGQSDHQTLCSVHRQAYTALHFTVLRLRDRDGRYWNPCS